MDIGNPNFTFSHLKDGKEEKEGKPIRFPAQAELVIDSLDRFTDPPGGPYQGQTISKLLAGLLTQVSPATNINIQNQRPLIYGYFHRLAITQIQIQVRLPTIIPNYNDKLLLVKNFSTAAVYAVVQIAPGYYTPTTLAAELQTKIRLSAAGTAGYTVTFSANTGFVFNTNTADTTAIGFTNFIPPSPAADEATSTIYYRTARTLGAGRIAFGVQDPTAVPAVVNPTPVFATFCPNFFPTDYIDFCSQAMTRYKRVKDAASTLEARQNIVARVYLNPPDSRQAYSPNSCPNDAPFVLTVEFDNPDSHKWSPEETLQNLDFQLYDMWGNQLYWSTEYNTEWQMTLLASES
jgi:hypothetical protein